MPLPIYELVNILMTVMEVLPTMEALTHLEEENLIHSVENGKGTNTFEVSLAGPHAIHRHLQYYPCYLFMYL